MAKNAISMAIACEEYGAKFFANGAAPSGVLEHPGTIKDPSRVRESWQSTFGGSANANKVAVLEEGMKYTLDPWVARWEQAMVRALFTPEEKKTYFFKFNVDGLLRGDYQSRMNGYATARQTWYGDEVTPKLFKDELSAGNGPITVWINSPGGDVFAAAQIYNMLCELPVRSITQPANNRVRTPKTAENQRLLVKSGCENDGYTI